MDLPSKIALLLIAVTVVLAALWLFAWPVWRRRQLDRRSFPESWLAVLKSCLPVYSHMSAAEQQRLQKLIMRFVASKRFVGCAGLSITDEIRVTVAAHACLLLLNRPDTSYSALRSILVYPSHFIVEHERRDEAGLVSQGRHVLAGESWSNGKVVLAWDDVEHGVRNFSDGYNVVLHEFAHQLDHQSGLSEAAPPSHSNAAYRNWAQVFSAEFAELQKASEQHMETLIDEYGATDPAEFFAVITETFYERPHQLAACHGALFEQLKLYYQVDPRNWQRPV